MNYCLLKDVWGNEFGCEIINEKYSIYDKSNIQETRISHLKYSNIQTFKGLKSAQTYKWIKRQL